MWRAEGALVLRRPPWEAPSAIQVAGDSGCRKSLRKGYSQIFLTTGRSGTVRFANSDAWFRWGSSPPDPDHCPNATNSGVRGPYSLDGERALMSGNRIRLRWSPRTVVAR